jgi:epoxyqueuosine reductase
MSTIDVKSMDFYRYALSDRDLRKRERNSTTEMNTKNSTKNIKSLIYNLGIDIVGIADLSKLINMPVGLKINLKELFDKYPYAIVLGAQYRKVSKSASGDETALYLEKIAYDVMGYLERKKMRCLVIHPEDEYDPENRMGLLSLKILAKEAGIGWQGRSLLIVSPEYGPIHRLIAILTNMKLKPDKPINNLCNDCTVCIDKCPKVSLKLCQFENHPESRRDVLDIKSCLGDNGCMVCILKCPYLNKKNRL